MRDLQQSFAWQSFTQGFERDNAADFLSADAEAGLSGWMGDEFVSVCLSQAVNIFGEAS